MSGRSFSCTHILVLLTWVISASPCPAQTADRNVPEPYQASLPEHPRLFATNARFIALKSQTDSVSRQLKAYVQHEAEKLLTAEKIVYPTKGFKFGQMRTVQGRILTLAMTNGSGTYAIDIEDLSQALNPQDSPNPGLTRIVVRLASQANSTSKLGVQIVPGSVAQSRR